MTELPLTPEIREIASRVIWFEQPEQSIVDVVRFVTYAMNYGFHSDMEVIRQYLTDDDLRNALDNAPPGIFDERSWANWNLKVGRYPTPPMPERIIPD
jgi:hypothetical protein